MKDPRPQPIHRRHYRPPEYWIDSVDLRVELGEEVTLVTARLAVRRDQVGKRTPFVLSGERLVLRSLEIDGVAVPEQAYQVDAETLTLPNVPSAFTLQTTVEIKPQENTELSGLYRSGDTFCTQCEAEGFRRITYFLDRPDVMARYSTTIVADATRYPVLLSNGNRVEQTTLSDGRQVVRWEDPFPKPSYLFALVAADLRCHRGQYTTRSGRDVALEIWVEPENVDACDHALNSLKKAMAWDERVFGLEYDLDVYMIVAVSDFNMAAMENKGLNIFNAKYVLARPETATDDDYEDIEGVIAHEYFHNWTGNRVTCRDWFQLTLKEGLTVFRDEQFTADMTSPPVKRILDVRTLRTAQFAEDQSPTAHPIRPESYIEMNNFYTVTVYNKGAEVVRMYQTLLGESGFRKGMDLYFERHDGCAVTCNDFRAAMADANGADLEQFGRWYEQAGTPIIEVKSSHDPENRTYSLTLRQHPPTNVDQADFLPLHIPIALGLVGPQGQDLPLKPDDPAVRVDKTTALVELRTPESTIRFEGVEQQPVVSVMRGFSAPVRVDIKRAPNELAFLMAHDSDPFCRWDAAQSLAQTLLLAAAGNDPQADLDAQFVQAFGQILADEQLDGSLKALTLRLPDERVLGQRQDVVRVDELHAARESAIRQLAVAHAQTFRSVYDAHHGQPYRLDQTAINGRRLKNLALGYLMATGADEAIELALDQLRGADNMTDSQAALGYLVNVDTPAATAAVAQFHSRWKQSPLVLDKWFSAQALSNRPDAVDTVIELSKHPDFNLRNPNRARSLLGVFSIRNQVRFHSADGRGYDFLADKILEIDSFNPQLAARLVAAFNQWRRFDEQRRQAMKSALARIVEHPQLSKDVFELTSKCLGAEAPES